MCNDESETLKRSDYSQKLKYQEQAIHCVSGNVLNEQRRAFEDCDGNLDKFYTSDPKDSMYFSKIIESGKVYELGYYNCTCQKVQSGECNNPELCECSRQSILHILNELMPKKKIHVEIIETILRGAKNCRFHIVIEDWKT